MFLDFGAQQNDDHVKRINDAYFQMSLQTSCPLWYITRVLEVRCLSHPTLSMANQTLSVYVMFREDNPTNGRKIDISASPLTGDQPVDTSLGWVDLQSFQKKKMTALTLKWELNQMANLGGTLPYFDKSASNIRLYANAGSEPWPDHEMVVPSDFVPNKDNPMIFVVETPQEEDAGDEDDGQYDQYGGGDVDENSYDNNYGNNPVDPYSNFTMRIQCTSDAGAFQ